MNIQKISHCSVTNPHWRIEKSLNSSKTMVWTIVENAGVIGTFFFHENVDENSYLKMLQDKLFTEFCHLLNAQELFFIQDNGNAPTRLQKNIRIWLNEKFPSRCIRRGRAEDFTWSPCSPDLTSAEFFMWGKIKIRHSHSVSTGFPINVICGCEKSLNLIIECNGSHIETQ